MRGFLKIIFSVILVLIAIKIALSILGAIVVMFFPLIILAGISFFLYRLWYKKSMNKRSERFFD